MKYKVFTKKEQTKAEFIITKRKITLALIIVLTLVAALKNDSAGNSSKKLLEAKSAIVALKFLEMPDNAEYQQALSQIPFCGWKISSVDIVKTSADYENTSRSGDITSKEIVKDNIKTTISVCISDNAKNKIDRSTGNNLIFILLLGAVLFMLVFFEDKKADEENEGNEDENKEVPNT